jgi:hypothetical protein
MLARFCVELFLLLDLESIYKEILRILTASTAVIFIILSFIIQYHIQ